MERNQRFVCKIVRMAERVSVNPYSKTKHLSTLPDQNHGLSYRQKVRLTSLGLPPSTLFNPLNARLRFSKKALVPFRMSWVPSMSWYALRSIFSAELTGMSYAGSLDAQHLTNSTD
jgi:hypothetical protein